MLFVYFEWTGGLLRPLGERRAHGQLQTTLDRFFAAARPCSNLSDPTCTSWNACGSRAFWFPSPLRLYALRPASAHSVLMCCVNPDANHAPLFFRCGCVCLFSSCPFPTVDLGQAQCCDGPAARAALGVPVLQGARCAGVAPGAGLLDGLHRLRPPAYTARGAPISMYPSCVRTHVVFVNHARFNTRKQHAIWVRLIFLEDRRVGRRCCGGCLERTRRRCLVVFFPFLAVPSSHFVRNPWCPLTYVVRCACA